MQLNLSNKMKRLLLAPVILLLTQISFAKEKLNYTVTSDSQIQNVEGNFEAIGNVVIKSSNNNFEASSNKLTYDKDARTLKHKRKKGDYIVASHWHITSTVSANSRPMVSSGLVSRLADWERAIASADGFG